MGSQSQYLKQLRLYRSVGLRVIGHSSIAGRDMTRKGGYTTTLVLNVIIATIAAQKAPKLFQGKLSITPKSNRNAKTIEALPKQKEPEYYDDYYYYDYYYDDPLPSGPTRRPAVDTQQQKQGRLQESEYDYYEEEPLPAGPTSEPPLPSGPTRRPGQPITFKPKPRNSLSPALNQFLNLPLLTTAKPRSLKTSKKVPKKRLLEKFGPFHQHFIAPPRINAGALPLAHESNIPLNRFPPFNNPGAEKK